MLNDKQKRELLRAEFPQMAEDDILNMQRFLDDYCELILRIFDRVEREKRTDFDRNPSIS